MLKNANKKYVPKEDVYTVEIRCQALKRAWGLIDHYFLVIGDYEYHMGWYSKGSILPVGTTAGAHVVTVKSVCYTCYLKIIENYNLREDKRLFDYYPLINCETLSTGLSVQALAILVLPFVFTLLLQGHILWAIILALASLVFFLTCSKYVFSRTTKRTCRHLC